MKTKLTLLASSAAVALCLATPANAASNWYVSVFGGAGWQGDNSFAAVTPAGTDVFTFTNDNDVGFVVGGAVGLSLGNVAPGLRVEAEVAYRENNANGAWTSDITTITGIDNGLHDYDHSSFSVMANAWYDFDLGDVKPYVGGGIGWADAQADGSYTGDQTAAFEFEEDGFAWQLGAGVRFDISPNMGLGVGYRYFRGPDIVIRSPGFITSTFDNDASGEIETENHSVLVDLTFGL